VLSVREPGWAPRCTLPGSCSVPGRTTDGLRNNTLLMIGMAVAFGIHLIAMYFPPVQALLRTTSPQLQDWLISGALGSVILVVMEIYKWLRHADEWRQ